MAYESLPPADIGVCSHYSAVCVLSSWEMGKEKSDGGQKQSLWEKKVLVVWE